MAATGTCAENLKSQDSVDMPGKLVVEKLLPPPCEIVAPPVGTSDPSREPPAGCEATEAREGSPASNSPASGEASPAVSRGSSPQEVEEIPMPNEGNPAVTVATNTTTKSSKEVAAKAKKREDRSIDYILKALGSLDTTEEKLAALCKRYTDLHEDNRLVQNSLKQSQKKLSATMRAKDQLQSEHSKAILAKSKLESLCRELQRHNKLIKDESLARAREEEEKRKEVSTKFTSTINDIQTQMQENQSRNDKLKNENLELAGKLKNLIDQYEKREEHVEKILKHKDLENQLSEAKLSQSNLMLAEEREKGLKEKQLLLAELDHYKKKCTLLEQTEKQLKAQLSLYTDKYEEFQSTLTKSNEVFGSFKTEMDKMTKKIKKLDKETNMWKTRWENSNTALLEMVEEKQKSDKETATLTGRVQKLEKLCRALQAERRLPAAKTNGSVPESDSSNYTLDTTDHNIEPTKAPPNTPSSRASPVEQTASLEQTTPDPPVVNGHADGSEEQVDNQPEPSSQTPASQPDEPLHTCDGPCEVHPQVA